MFKQFKFPIYSKYSLDFKKYQPERSEKVRVSSSGLSGTVSETYTVVPQFKGKYKSFAGIRTFPLISLCGGLVAYLGKLVSVWILIVGVVVFASLIISAYYSASVKSKYHGITTALAALLAFFVGILALSQQLALAVLVGIVVAVLLYAKNFLHHFAEKIKRQELVDTLKFVVIAFVILPFLPNQGYGPHDLFNPFIIWLMVVFISGISFAGYILMKWFGERGIEMAGIFGGLVSSTAVTTSFAHRSQKEKKILLSLVLGVILANSIMFIRILIEVFVINRTLLNKLIVPLSILFLVSLVFSYFLFRKATQVKKHKLDLGSPFTIKPALKFGLFFAVILALVKLANVYLSSQGVYLVSFLSGFADVDAITVSLSQLAKKDLALGIAQKGIMIAALTNVAVKGGIAYFFGSKEFGKLVVGLFVVLILIGLGLVWVF